MMLPIRLCKQEHPTVMPPQAGIQEMEPVAVLTWIPGSSPGMTKKAIKVLLYCEGYFFQPTTTTKDNML